MFNFDSIITVILHGGWFLLLLNRFRINFAFKNARTLVLCTRCSRANCVLVLFAFTLIYHTKKSGNFRQKAIRSQSFLIGCDKYIINIFFFFFIKNEPSPFLIFKSVAFGSDPSWPDQAKKGSDTNRSGSALVHSDVKKIESEIIGLIVRYSYVCIVVQYTYSTLADLFLKLL